MEIIQITHYNLTEYQSRLANLEKSIYYPLGDSFFRINHGGNYLNFFNRLGKPYVFAVIYQHEIIATATIVLRNILSNNKKIPVWYLCDFKIAHQYFGKSQIITKLIYKFSLPICLESSNMAYGITMNSRLGRAPLLRLLDRMLPIKFSAMESLKIFSLTFEQLNRISMLLSQHFGKFSFSSLAGIKDLILKNEKKNEHPSSSS